MSNAKSGPVSPRLKAAPTIRNEKKIRAPRPRITGNEREALILAEAVRFFADVGFSGDTRELARRAHVTHPLLYKYFATKEVLIERVYEAVYLETWKPAWEALIADRTVPLRERMTRFYLAFSDVLLNREWVRLFMFFGLRGADINERWFGVVRERVVLPLCGELRHDVGLPAATEIPITRVELELVQGISSRIFAWGIRQHIYGMPLPDDAPNVPALIQAEIDVFFDGIGATLHKLVPKHDALHSRSASKRSSAPVGNARARRMCS